MLRLLLLALCLSGLEACSSSTAESPRPHVITGVVIEIESGQGFGAVQSFSVKEGERIYRIYTDDDITYDFPLSHLNSHRVGADPVTVEAEAQADRLVAVSISDA